ncbi:MAG: cation:proton antiporter [Myxococcales bacterium]|nr:cation:proton antiporter [Myxococcales bacterium]
MHGSRILVELVIILGAAAVTTVLFSVLRLPVALGYILAGLAIGPHVPIPVVASSGLVAVLSELGVILLMFSIGLEFSIRSIARAGVATAATALFEVALMVSLGYLVARLFGWTSTEALFAGAAVGISSTMLVARAFEELGVGGELRSVVYAVLVFEDLIAIVLLAVLTAVASGRGLSSAELLSTLAQLAGFLLAILAVGLLVVPRVVRLIAERSRSETLLITALAICFAMASLAEQAGFSVALGAFLAGVLVAESGKARQVEELIHPFRDAFAAVFFVSVGMSIDPGQIAAHPGPVVALSVLVLVGKSLGVTLGGFLAGQGVYRSVRAGLTLAQVGEFSFILIAVGVKAGVVGGFLLPVVVAASCVTAFTTPWMIRSSDRLARWVDHHLPRPLATLVSLYEGWISRLGAQGKDSLVRRLRRPVFVLLADAAAFTAIVIGIPTVGPSLASQLSARAQLDERLAASLVVGGAAALAGLFLLAVVRRVLRLALLLAREVIPARPAGDLDLGAAPRQALRWTLSLGLALLLGVPMAAITQPFVPGGPAVIGALAAFIGVAAWRAIRNLDGHVRAGSALIVEVLARQTGADAQSHEPEPTRALHEASIMLPGITELTPVELPADSQAVGKSLAELDLRARTGATVLALRRDGVATAQPSPHQPLRAGDVLALTGSLESVARAAAELTAREAGTALADATSG